MFTCKCMSFSKILTKFNMVEMFLLKNSSYKMSQISVQWEQVCFMPIDRETDGKKEGET